MKVKDIDKLKQRLEVRLSPSNSGSITISARANAIKGRVP